MNTLGADGLADEIAAIVIGGTALFATAGAIAATNQAYFAVVVVEAGYAGAGGQIAEFAKCAVVVACAGGASGAVVARVAEAAITVFVAWAIGIVCAATAACVAIAVCDAGGIFADITRDAVGVDLAGRLFGTGTAAARKNKNAHSACNE